jgi:hypothetical protein
VSGRLLASRLAPSAAIGEAPSSQRFRGGYRLGFPGVNPRVPQLHVITCDNSASVAWGAGADTIGRRFEEARAAISSLARFADRETLVGLVPFDQIGGGHVPVGPVARRRHRVELERELRVPPDAPGTSDLTPAVEAVEGIASKHPQHEVTWSILSDWKLTDDDPDGLYRRLADFPGTVHAIGLNLPVPGNLVGPRIWVTNLTSDSPLGSVAIALHRALTTGRPGRTAGSVLVPTKLALPSES